MFLRRLRRTPRTHGRSHTHTPPNPLSSRWCNSYLRERSIEIDDLFTDVSDGTVLLNLLEIIGQETILSVCGRKFYPPQKCKMDIHKLEVSDSDK